MDTTQQTGARGEEEAAAYLRSAGYHILFRNWRYGHYELDIIAKKNEMLHFVEVKTLSTSQQVYPEVHLTGKKMESMKKAARQYLFLHPGYTQIQFDLVSVILRNGADAEIFLIEDIYS